jgi:hypothetical protein
LGNKYKWRSIPTCGSHTPRFSMLHSIEVPITHYQLGQIFFFYSRPSRPIVKCWVTTFVSRLLRWRKVIKIFIDMREPLLRKTWEYSNITTNLSHKLWKRLAPGMSGRFSMLKVPVLALIIETSAVWPWYRRSFQDICRGLWIIIAERAYLWLISHDLSHGVPLMIFIEKI